MMIVYKDTTENFHKTKSSICESEVIRHIDRQWMWKQDTQISGECQSKMARQAGSECQSRIAKQVVNVKVR